MSARHEPAESSRELGTLELGTSIVAPGHKKVLPLPPEFIAPQDGVEKQDYERNAAKRWLAKHGDAVAHLRPVFLGDDLFACQPNAADGPATAPSDSRTGTTKRYRDICVPRVGGKSGSERRAGRRSA